VIEWKTKRSQETVRGSDGENLVLDIEELLSLEDTIDDLFAELEKTGNPSLLEELCPYFGCVWPSARGLAQFLLEKENNPERDGAVRAIEVGCGLAIPSMVFSKRFRLSKIIATDFHPEVPKFLERNLALNAIPKDRFEYRALDWRNPPAELGKFGLVIGSDILYEKTHPADVADALVRIVKPSGRIVIADPARPYLQVFVDEMKARGFGAEPKVYAVRADAVNPGLKEVILLDFRRID
jgi:predicted nicotinamide N-methyase